MYLYTAHIPTRFMAVNNSIIGIGIGIGRGWDRTSACKIAAGSRYQSIVDLTHPTHAYIWRKDRRPDHNTGNSVL